MDSTRQLRPQRGNESVVGCIGICSVAFTPMLLMVAKVVPWDHPYLGSTTFVPETWMFLVLLVHYVLLAYWKPWTIAFSRDTRDWQRTRRRARAVYPIPCIGFVVGVVMVLRELLTS